MHERLTVLDASLLDLDNPRAPLHTGGVSVFRGAIPFWDVHEALQARLDRVPLARRRVREVPFGGRPVWVDDPDFDLSYHLRHAALPQPGDDGQLGEFVSRLIARPLDRQRPLWELYVIEGLEGGRTALFRKVHLAMAGGDHGDPFAALLDDEADVGAEAAPTSWEPEEEPSVVELAADAARERAAEATRAGRGLADVATHPARAAGAATAAVGSVAGIAARLAQAAPRSPLNRRLTSHRRFATTQLDLDAMRSVRTSLGGSVNDAVVAVCADAVGRLLRWRGHETKDLDLRVMVPVRVHGDAGGGELDPASTIGEGAVGVIAPLPVMEMDPVARLYRVMGELAGLKESRQAVAADHLVRLAGYGPATLHATAARLVIGEQRYNFALSNAPGPQTPRWLAGVPLEASYPFIPLSGDAALSIAVTSYTGVMCVGLLGEWRAMPDLPRLATFIGESADDLCEAAQVGR